MNLAGKAWLALIGLLDPYASILACQINAKKFFEHEVMRLASRRQRCGLNLWGKMLHLQDQVMLVRQGT